MQIMILNHNKVAFSEDSIIDDFGRIFFYEGKVFRAINKNHISECVAFLESDLLKELIEKRYVPQTRIADFQIEGFGLILEHEVISESKPHHWSFNMFKDAALFLLQINRVCNQYGYELKDGHQYNVFFKNNYPIFVDFGSIVKLENSSKWLGFAYEEFLNFSYIQLLIWSKGDFFLARRLIEDGIQPVLRTIPMSRVFDSHLIDFVSEDVFDYKLFYKGALLHSDSKNSNAISYLTRGVDKLASLVLKKPIKAFLYTKTIKSPEFVEEKIRSLKRPLSGSTWENYHDHYKSGAGITSTPRFDRILQLIREHAYDIRSMVDLAGNQGVFCYLMSQAFTLDRVVLTDYDEKAIDTAYLSFKKDSIKIEPYLHNFMMPAIQKDVRYLKSDIAFALAITHHLVLSQMYLLPAIFNVIKEYSNKYVVIEFMPLGLWGGEGNALPSVPEWYTLEWFKAEFERHFSLLAQEQVEENRIVFIGAF